MIRRTAPEAVDEVAETFIASVETLLTFLPNLHKHHGRGVDGSGNEERVPDVRYEWRPD